MDTSNIGVIFEYLPRLFQGALLTLAVAATSFFFSFVIGMIGAQMRLSRFAWVRAIASAYSSILRGVPELVWMLLLFFGIQMWLNQWTEYLGFGLIEINPFTAGVLVLSLIYGAYFTETIRGAIMAIPPGQMEAGMAYGMSSFQVFFRVLVPQMIRLAIPGFTNNWLVLTKATALISVVGLQDMMFKAKQAADATREPFTFFLAVAAMYLVLTSVSLLALRQLEKRYSVGVRAADL